MKIEKLTKCPDCRSKIKLKYKNLKDRLDTVRGRFGIWECLSCSLIFTNPLPTNDLGILYPDFYLSEKKSNQNLDLENWYRENQYEFDFSLFTKSTGITINKMKSHLDVGCGSGERVVFLQKHGCKRSWGLDKFDQLRSATKNIVNDDILNFVPKEKFDIVSLFHVLEHLQNKKEVLKHIQTKILKPNGYLITQVPNYTSFERSFFGQNWFGFDVPRHLWHFSPDYLKSTLVGLGFNVLRVYQKNALLHSVSLIPSIFQDLDIQRIWVKSKEGSPSYWKVMKLLWVIATVVTIPVTFIINLTNKSSMLTIISKNTVNL